MPLGIHLVIDEETVLKKAKVRNAFSADKDLPSIVKASRKQAMMIFGVEIFIASLIALRIPAF